MNPLNLNQFTPRSRPVAVSYDSRKLRYRKVVGCHRSDDGAIRPRAFWLGSDQAIAVITARVLVQCWTAIKAGQSDAVWTPALEQWAFGLASRQITLGEPSTPVNPPAVVTNPVLPPQSLASVRVAPPADARVVSPEKASSGTTTDVGGTSITLAVLAARYQKHADNYYVDPDRLPTEESRAIRLAMVPMLQLHGMTRAQDFGPLALKAVRDAMVGRGWCRGYVNQQIGRIKRMVRWATENEMVPPSVHHGLQAVRGLRKNRSPARESCPVVPVPDADVEAVRSRVSETVRAMIDLQLLTGMRPGEVVIIRGQDIDRGKTVWVYRPHRHKSQHRGQLREVCLGPKAQRLLLPFIKRNPTGFLFSPAQAEKDRRARLHRERKSPLSCGNRPGTNRVERPCRKPGLHYDVSTYRRAIARACAEASRQIQPPDAQESPGKSLAVTPWHPHQLRHNAATRLRKEYGLEAARVVLGHRSSAVTEIYAEADADKARQVMQDVG